MFGPDFWSSIGQILTVVVALSGSVSFVKRIYDWARSKTSVAKLEETVETHSKYLKNDADRLLLLEERMSASEKDRRDIHMTTQILLKGVQALLSDDPADKKSADKEINEYLSKKF